MSIRGDAQVLAQFLDEGITQGDALDLLPRLPHGSVDLFFTSPPYADARAYSRIYPDHYVDWFLPFAKTMYHAAKESGSLILNIKNRVAKQGPLKGQRHPYEPFVDESRRRIAEDSAVDIPGYLQDTIMKNLWCTISETQP